MIASIKFSIMSNIKRKYTSTYKRNAVQLSKERNNVAQSARELGIGAQMIHRWKKELEDYEHNSFPGHGKVKQTDEQREINSLKKALKNKELELEILKKAISIFSESDRKNIDL
jgi:transposase